MTNLLYYGDNLDVLRRYVKDESVDLVYLDPPFNSNQDYNVLFAERSGARAAAQIQAFEDTWRWDRAAAEAFQEVVEAGGKVSQVMQGFLVALDPSDLLAYLSMMAPRLVELRRVLKPTGSLYLHCDPSASHYLKVLLDAVFGPTFFRTEIVWKRSAAHSDSKQGRRQHGHVHDVILFYTKGNEWTWNTVFTEYDKSYVDSHYRWTEDGTGRRYRKGDLTAAKPGGDTSYEWHGVRPYTGRYWAYSRANMEEFEAQGRLIYTKSGMPEYKRYLDEMPGLSVQDVWTDVDPINSQAAERLGYPTQKPEKLLERIIGGSSDEDDVVLDPFCGCGTAVAVAQRMNRRWIGIDITNLAITLIRHRLRDAYGAAIEQTYRVIGEPVSVEDAGALAAEDPYQFQWWALGLVGARPVEQKKGADQGIDGRLYFHDEAATQTKQIIFSVKSGHTGRHHVHELRGVIEREHAEIGVLITMQEPTKPMREEAASAGFYTFHDPSGDPDDPGKWVERRYPRIQLVTVGELLDGKRIEYPPSQARTFRKAPPAVKDSTGSLFDEG